ncbi:hypothetical protein DMI69_22720 [Escherichia coli]|nr:hypothetical protein [Escherichia coli]
MPEPANWCAKWGWTGCRKISLRVCHPAAQGIGAGLLTARLGIKAMELCRPLPWIDDDKPRLGISVVSLSVR